MTESSINYQQQLQQKIDLTEAEFSHLIENPITVFRSPESAYRMRAEFKAWHENNKVAYAMHTPGQNKNPYTITTFSAGSETIQKLMPTLLVEINQSKVLRHKLFQIEFLTSTTGQALVGLIYHAPLEDAWRTAANTVAQNLKINIIGRSHKQKIVIGVDYVIEQLTIAEREFRYQQIEGSFTQPNAHMCQHMLNWACQHAQALGGDLLELYCGNGNFTLPLSLYFNRVLATEVSKTSIKSALYNCEINNITNINFVRMSSEELTQALNKERPFERLKAIDLDSYQFSTIFVDPPRAGLDAETNKLVQRFDNILYISCNPETLKNNIQAISDTHKAVQMALFDQFPFTPHRECGVVLKRR